MNNEIKEILNQLEIVARKHAIEVCEDMSKIEIMPASVVDELRLNNYSSKLLLDYIINLQTIEQQYSAILSGNVELENKITDLEQELEEEKRIEQEDFKLIQELEEENEKLKNMLKRDEEDD